MISEERSAFLVLAWGGPPRFPVFAGQDDKSAGLGTRALRRPRRTSGVLGIKSVNALVLSLWAFGYYTLWVLV